MSHLGILCRSRANPRRPVYGEDRRSPARPGGGEGYIDFPEPERAPVGIDRQESVEQRRAGTSSPVVNSGF